MRIGVLADVHGNVDALTQALDRLAGQVDEVLFAGDAFSDHRFSNEAVEALRAAGARYVLGNHELGLLAPAGARARGAAHVRRSALDHVAAQPTSIRTTIGGTRLLMVHGSPWPPHSAYVAADDHGLGRVEELEVDLVVLGHTHHAFTRRVGRTLVVNPGSLGRSDHPDAGDDVTYAVVDTDGLDVRIESFPNPLLTPR